MEANKDKETNTETGKKNLKNKITKEIISSFINPRSIITAVAVLLACILVFLIARSIYKPKENIVIQGSVEKTSNISGKTLKSSLNNLGILETASYNYTHVEKYDSDRTVLGFKIPFTKSKFIYTYDGNITAGIDCSQIEVDTVDQNIIVTLPPSSIQSSEIDPNSFNLYDEKNNIFNPITVTDVNNSLMEMKSAEENAAIEKGLLTRADANAKILIENFLKNIPGISDYTIQFEVKPTEVTAETE